MKLYVVVDVGCIECGEDTKVIGGSTNLERALDVFNTRAQAVGADKLSVVRSKQRGETLIGKSPYFITFGERSLQIHVQEGEIV